MARPMPTPPLARDVFLVHEHLGLLKAANNYDILDPQTREVLLHCREDRLGWITSLLRFTDYHTLAPFDVALQLPDGATLARVRRGYVLLRSTVRIEDGGGGLIGTLRQRLLSLGGAFTVLDPHGAPVCALKGSWTGFDYRLVQDGVELAQITKQWGGLAKELFTSADDYLVRIDPRVPADSPIRLLILGAAICIDMVLKEN
jgi:uncharacterized protein YxjI